MKMIISTGTRVIASKEENPTASVFVQASGLNMRPSCASSRKTGRNETTMISREKNRAGPTCLAAAIRIRRRSRSGTPDFVAEAGGDVITCSSELSGIELGEPVSDK